jgi:hypothetical protein
MKDRIIETLTRIETKLDEVIAALHAYDGDEWPEPNDALKEAATQYNKLVAPCRGHDAASWDAEEAERRMDIIGQNGNEGLHYGDVENEFDDYGMRVVDRDKDNNNTQGNERVGGKKRNKRKYYKPKNKG